MNVRMIGLPRLIHPLLLALFAPALLTAPAQEPPKALPLNAPPPPLAVPAVVDVVTFNYRTEGEQHHLAITSTPARLRVDELDDGYSIIYDPQTEFYTGLENRNYTYWEFSWPQVKTAVQSSQRGEARLRELGAEGFNGDSPDTSPAPAPTDSATASPPDTNSPDATSSASAGSDTSGYTWQPATEHKRVAGFDCVRWVGHSLSAGDVNAWCHAGPVPKVQNALEAVRAINEPIALVPVRTLVPTFVYEVYDDLVKGGVTPLAIDWGDQRDKSYFELVGIKSREGKTTLFTVPKLYLKTTLVTMDGMLSPVKDQEKHPEQAHHEKDDRSMLPMP
jgi:hypothetical protein